MTTAQEQDVTAPPDDLRDEADLLARIATLTAENKALREKVREQVLWRDEWNMGCRLCDLHWSAYDSVERHAPGCLAAGAANER